MGSLVSSTMRRRAIWHRGNVTDKWKKYEELKKMRFDRAALVLGYTTD